MSDARAEAERRHPVPYASPHWRSGFVAGAEWQASRPVTEAEVEAAAYAIWCVRFVIDDRELWESLSHAERGRYQREARAALEAARKVQP